MSLPRSISKDVLPCGTPDKRGESMVGNQNDLASRQGADLHSARVQATDGVVQGHTAADVGETGIPFLHQFRSGRGIAVVCLDDTSFHLGGDQPPGDLVIVKPTGHDIGRRMQVEIVGSFREVVHRIHRSFSGSVRQENGDEHRHDGVGDEQHRETDLHKIDKAVLGPADGHHVLGSCEGVA